MNFFPTRSLHPHYFAGINDTFIKFISPPNEIHWFEKPSDSEFIVKYWGYPVPNVVWYDNYGREIPWNDSESDDNKFQTLLDEKNSLTALKIKNPNIIDCGKYILSANNSLMEKNITFELVIQGIY